MHDLLIITPTRARAENAMRLARAVALTATARTDLILAVDDDDPSYDGTDFGAHVQVVRGPRMNCVRWSNKIAAEMAPRYRALASFGDDHVPRTPGWDSAMLAAIEDMGGTGITYGDDTRQHEHLPTAPVMSSSIPAALGWFFLPVMGHYYCDDAWRDIGQRAGCLRYLPEIIIEHLHPAFGTAPHDEVYGEAERDWNPDTARYSAWTADPDGLAADAQKVRDLMRELAP